MTTSRSAYLEDSRPSKVYRPTQSIIYLSPERYLIDPVIFPPTEEFSCDHMAHSWPCWVGGHYSFEDAGQPFYELNELRLTTMLEE